MGCALHLTFYMVHISIFFFSFFWLINRAKADTKNCQQTLNLKLKTCFCRSIYDLSVAAPCQYFCDASCTGSSCNSRIGFVVVANFKYVVLTSTSLVVAESKSYCWGWNALAHYCEWSSRPHLVSTDCACLLDMIGCPDARVTWRNAKLIQNINRFLPWFSDMQLEIIPSEIEYYC